MPRRRTARPLVIGVSSAIALVALFASGAMRPVTDPVVRVAVAVAAPLYRIGAAMSAKDPDAMLTDAQRTALRTEIDGLRLENAKLRNSLEELDQLRATLDYRERDLDATLVTHVISQRDGAFAGFVVDRGSEDGVVEGAPVLAPDGAFIGKIAEVHRQTSAVRALTDAGSRVAVAVRNGTDTLGVLEGQRGLSMAVSLVPQSEVLSPGDVVITSGAEAGIRRGYPIGTIEKVQRSTQDPFQTATITPFTSTQQPVFLQVVLPGGAETADAP